MKNKSIVWMLAALGFVGCNKEGKVVEIESDNDKTLHWCCVHGQLRSGSQLNF